MSGVICRLVEFVREVDRGIAVGYGYEPRARVEWSRYDDFRAR